MNKHWITSPPPAAWLCLALLGCAAAPSPLQAPSKRKEDHFRPDWTAAIPLHVSEIRACLADRQEPTAVVHLQELATGETGITAVDGFGALENCAARDTTVVMRGPSPFHPEDLAGLPLFSFGADAPHVSAGIVLEEVSARDDQDAVVGWLYWPERDPSSGRANGGEASALEHARTHTQEK